MTVSTDNSVWVPDMENLTADPQVFADLTAQDRCDRCGAAALAQVRIPGVESTVLLCGHHFRNNREMFDERGYTYQTSLKGVDAGVYTWASHAEPWENQFRDAGSANA